MLKEDPLNLTAKSPCMDISKYSMEVPTELEDRMRIRIERTAEENNQNEKTIYCMDTEPVRSVGNACSGVERRNINYDIENSTCEKPFYNHSQEDNLLCASRQQLLVSNLKPILQYGLCCCCLELECQKSLWSEYSWMGSVEVYGDMLEKCYGLSIPRHQSTKQICEVCITQLRSAVGFKHQVLRCQDTLANQLTDKARIDAEPSNLCSGGLGDQSINACKVKEGMDTVDGGSMKKTKIINEHCEDVKLKPPKSSDGRTLNFIKPRRNASLLLKHSTILPFRSNKGYFNCFYCHKQYVIIEHVRNHIAECHRNLSLKTIAKSIHRPRDRIRADVSNMSCRICAVKLRNVDELTQHLTKTHHITFNDDVTDTILPYDLGDGKYRCYHCKNEFFFFKTLTKHMNEHSSNYVCDVCGLCFILPERLRAHVQKHSVQKPTQCQYCTKVFTSNSRLRSHVRYTHKKVSYMCSVCQESFKSYRSRLHHLETVHERTPLNLNCKLCTKTFLTPSSLTAHVKNEHLKITKEAKFLCGQCPMKFKSKYALGCHLVVHSGEKRFECAVCHKRYTRANTLAEHLKIHLNDRRWSCGRCGQSFVQKCSVKNHIKVHHNAMDAEQLIVYNNPVNKLST